MNLYFSPELLAKRHSTWTNIFEKLIDVSLNQSKPIKDDEPSSTTISDSPKTIRRLQGKFASTRDLIAYIDCKAASNLKELFLNYEESQILENGCSDEHNSMLKNEMKRLKTEYGIRFKLSALYLELTLEKCKIDVLSEVIEIDHVSNLKNLLCKRELIRTKGSSLKKINKKIFDEYKRLCPPLCRQFVLQYCVSVIHSFKTKYLNA